MNYVPAVLVAVLVSTIYQVTLLSHFSDLIEDLDLKGIF